MLKIFWDGQPRNEILSDRELKFYPIEDFSVYSENKFSFSIASMIYVIRKISLTSNYYHNHTVHYLYIEIKVDFSYFEKPIISRPIFY